MGYALSLPAQEPPVYVSRLEEAGLGNIEEVYQDLLRSRSQLMSSVSMYCSHTLHPDAWVGNKVRGGSEQEGLAALLI